MPDAYRTQAHVPEKADLHRLFMLRNVAIVGQIVTVAVVVMILKIPLPLADIASIIGAVIVFNAFHLVASAPELAGESPGFFCAVAG